MKLTKSQNNKIEYLTQFSVIEEIIPEGEPGCIRVFYRMIDELTTAKYKNQSRLIKPRGGVKDKVLYDEEWDEVKVIDFEKLF